jgi:hypothetical protein
MNTNLSSSFKDNLIAYKTSPFAFPGPETLENDNHFWCRFCIKNTHEKRRFLASKRGSEVAPNFFIFHSMFRLELDQFNYQLCREPQGKYGAISSKSSFVQCPLTRDVSQNHVINGRGRFALHSRFGGSNPVWVPSSVG